MGSYAPQFKEISAAYEVLGDAKKRSTYDEGGMEALKEGSGGPRSSARDVFDMFFGGGRRANREKRTRDMVHPLRVGVAGTTTTGLLVCVCVCVCTAGGTG